MNEITKKITEILEQRKNSNGEKSYTKSLFEKGDEAILKKIIEEAGEVLMATKDNDNDKIIYEVADLYFHILVLLSHKNITTSKIEDELNRRFGVSGIEEKNSRK
jgi:phosphoribosyl-ATP pyrophosphohydrolase